MKLLHAILFVTITLFTTIFSSNVSAEVSLIDVYAGPGFDYNYMGTINKDNIYKAVKIDGNWIEIECYGNRGYILISNVPELAVNNIPRVISTLSQNVTPYPQILNYNIDIQLYDDAEIFSSPSNTESLDRISAGQNVKVLCVEKNGFIEYAQFEINENGKKWRGYSRVDDLLSWDNPLKDFEEVKKNNAIIYYKGKNYYSTTGIGIPNSVGKNWKVIAEKDLIKSDFDIMAGITNMIAANGDTSDHIVKVSGGRFGEDKLYNLNHNKLENVNFENTRTSNAINVADFFLESSVNFLAGANKSTYFKINLLECDGESKIILRTGKPIELPYAGKKTTLQELLVQQNSTNLVKHADDEQIKKMYPELRKDKLYSMSLEFSGEIWDNPYGYYIAFDKNLLAYAVPIIHNGTHMYVYSEGNLLFDAANDISRSLIPLSESDSQMLKNLLKENGFYLSQKKIEINEEELIQEKKFNKNIPSDAYKYGDHYYYIYSNICDTWDEADKYCKNLGGHLAVINDANENNALYEMMKSRGYNSAYFGLSDVIKQDNWCWVTGEPLTYTNWNRGEPNHERDKEHYGMFYWKFSYTWNDGDFGNGTNAGGNAFICEWDNNLRPYIDNIEKHDTEVDLLKQIVGTYKGSYFPPQGETGLTLTIFEDNKQIKALFEFYNLPGKSNSKSGSYYMNVTYDNKLSQYVLNGYEWINRPGLYEFANLKGNFANGVLSGNAPWRFRVQRIID